MSGEGKNGGDLYNIVKSGMSGGEWQKVIGNGGERWEMIVQYCMHIVYNMRIYNFNKPFISYIRTVDIQQLSSRLPYV